VKPFNAKNGTLYHGDVEAVTRDRIPGILQVCHDNPATGGHFGRFPAQFTLSQSTDACLYLDNSSADHYDVCFECSATFDELMQL